jgi:hypothetical protein
MRVKFSIPLVAFYALSHLVLVTTSPLYSQSNLSKISVNINNIKNHLNSLGSDKFKGRGTGTEGELEAAEYIVDYLKKTSLIPMGDRNSFFQKVPMHGSYPLKSSQFILNSNNSPRILSLGQDYLLYKTGAETYIPILLPLVFVGYGIIAPEFDYNDYQSVDVEDKVVVFLSGEPFSEDPTFFNGLKPTIYSHPESKQRIAIARGAKGSIMIPFTEDVAHYNWEHWVQEFAFEYVTLAYTVTSHMSALLNPSMADYLFVDTPFSYKDIVEMHRKGKLSSFELKTKVSFEGVFEERDFVARNIIGMVEGIDDELKDTYVILSAHYDHIGIGPPVKGDSIYNGVLDNALGTAALMEISRFYGELKPKRSMLFLFLTGEEKGLLGSTYYTDHPAVPLYKTIAAVNIDGIAAFDEFEDIIGVGSELSSLEDDLLHVAKNLDLGVSNIPDNYFYESETISRSDQFSFIKAGIPSVLIAEGIHYKNTGFQEGLNRLIQWTKNVYHTPFDDLNQPINFDAVKQHTEFITYFTRYLANKSGTPQWNPGSPYLNAQLQSIAEKR